MDDGVVAAARRFFFALEKSACVLLGTLPELLQFLLVKGNRLPLQVEQLRRRVRVLLAKRVLQIGTLLQVATDVDAGGSFSTGGSTALPSSQFVRARGA